MYIICNVHYVFNVKANLTTIINNKNITDSLINVLSSLIIYYSYKRVIFDCSW